MTEEISVSHKLEELRARRDEQRTFHNHKETVIYLAMGAILASIPFTFGASKASPPLQYYISNLAAFGYFLALIFVRWQQRQRELSAVLIDLYNKTSAELLGGGIDASEASEKEERGRLTRRAHACMLWLFRQTSRKNFMGPNIPKFMYPTIDKHFDESERMLSSKSLLELGRQDVGGQIPTIAAFAVTVASIIQALLGH